MWWVCSVELFDTSRYDTDNNGWVYRILSSRIRGKRLSYIIRYKLQLIHHAKETEQQQRILIQHLLKEKKKDTCLATTKKDKLKTAKQINK